MKSIQEELAKLRQENKQIPQTTTTTPKSTSNTNPIGLLRGVDGPIIVGEFAGQRKTKIKDKIK